MDQLYSCSPVEYQTGKMYRLLSENVRLRAYPFIGSCGKSVAVKVERRVLTRFSVVTGFCVTVFVQFLQKYKFSSTVGLMCLSQMKMLLHNFVYVT